MGSLAAQPTVVGEVVVGWRSTLAAQPTAGEVVVGWRMCLRSLVVALQAHGALQVVVATAAPPMPAAAALLAAAVRAGGAGAGWHTHMCRRCRTLPKPVGPST